MIRPVLWLLLLTVCLVLPVSAETYASQAESFITVNSEGDCIVSMSVRLYMDAPVESLTFPLPLNATDITLNGGSARTTKTDTASEVDVTRATGGMAGEIALSFNYNIPNAVKANAEVRKQFPQMDLLQLDLPLLCGFSYPVKNMKFVITMPANIKYVPSFTSIYQQTSFESYLDFDIDKNMITGQTTAEMNDHEAFSMVMLVPSDMFPTVSTYLREGNPEIVPMLVFAGLALLYWLLFLRTLPLIRRRSVTAPEGITAGEVGCHLTLAGGDLTMMSIHWAQMGYILIQLEGRRVMLYKRMDMGNERSPFEVKVFNMLFNDRTSIDATGIPYTRLSRKVFTMIPGERSLRKPGIGSTNIFRAFCCGSQVFCGICVAMNMTSVGVLQVLLSIILALFGIVSAWQIHEIAYRTHLRGKTRVYVGLVFMLIWILLGILCGQWIIPLCAVLGQFLMGYLAAYGGRRSDLGRHDAGQILGLRSYLKHISREDINRLMRTDPDYFFNMLPFALALGVIQPFAKNFGQIKLSPCPYLVTRLQGKQTAEDWAEILADTADLMDARFRKMELERWTAPQLRK